jgi:NADH dehydrogenase [ubiquinone] 1 alpha subcomplex assembly factor 5
MAGAGSLSTLRRAIGVADGAIGGAVPARLHPQIEVRAAGDLLARAGFAMPVADGEGLDVRYGSLSGLIADLRGMAATSQLRGQRGPWFGRARLAHLAEAFARDADPDGRIRERFEMVFLTGWSPAPGQPQPAKRGSATASLAAALKGGDQA